MQIRIMKIEDYEQVYNMWLSCTGMGISKNRNLKICTS